MFSEVIWPANEEKDAADAGQASQPVGSNNKSPSEEAISSLIEKIFQTQSFDESLIDQLHTLPDFQVTLRRHLHERLEKKEILHPKILSQLLGISFDAQQHLDWVLFKGLPTDAIAAALEMPELKEAKSISLCIDTIRGTHEQLLESLSLSTSLRELYLFQEPTRESDNKSAELFLELLSTSHLHLLRCKIVLSGPFSSSLSKRFWLPTTSSKLNIGTFPIQHMFVRRQITGSVKDNPIFSPKHFYLGDALLTSERFAAGFLQFLRSLITGETMMETQLYSFACAPSTLNDMSSKEISSIPIENFTIPVRPTKWDVERRLVAGLPALRGYEALLPVCWPKVRDLVAGDWVVLVSKDQYRDPEAIKRMDHNIFPYPSTQTRFIQYAFVRLKTPISVDSIPENLGPEMIEVGGLKEFLRATAPEVDQDLVDQRLKELKIYISNTPEQIPLGPGLDWVSVFKPHEACAVLKDFLEDAVYVKGNLRLAMEDDPEGVTFLPFLSFFRMPSQHNNVDGN